MSVFAAHIATAQSQQQRKRNTIYRVSFQAGSIEFRRAYHETIYEAAAMMERDPAIVAMALGKADTVGSAEDNEHLSWRRAAAVFEALAFTYKVPDSRVEMCWAGERLPTVHTGEEKAELEDRVVDIVVH
jgi:outer membrane protein OmpA-like peptidoglycan-associated protein